MSCLLDDRCRLKAGRCAADPIKKRADKLVRPLDAHGVTCNEVLWSVSRAEAERAKLRS